MKVFWAVLLERAIQEYGVSSLLNVAMNCGANGYTRMFLPYMRTDTARNVLVSTFMEQSTDENDTLVMLDCDHNHPLNVVQQLVSYPVGVAGALYFRRSEPHDPLMFMRNKETGKLHSIVKWDEGAKLIQCDVVATGAIAIKRWVFSHLMDKGIYPPFFRYAYQDNNPIYQTEDVYFGIACSLAGIPHYCDVSLQLPHLTVAEVTQDSWDKWKEDHPEPAMEMISTRDY